MLSIGIDQIISQTTRTCRDDIYIQNHQMYFFFHFFHNFWGFHSTLCRSAGISTDITPYPARVTDIDFRVQWKMLGKMSSDWRQYASKYAGNRVPIRVPIFPDPEIFPSRTWSEKKSSTRDLKRSSVRPKIQ